MVHTGSCSVLASVRTQVNASCIPVVGCNTVVGLCVAAGNCKSVQVVESQSCSGFEPVGTCAEVIERIIYCPVRSVLLGSHHVKFILRSIQSHGSAIGRVDVSVLASLFEIDEDDTITSARSVDCGCRTVLEHIDRLDIRRVDVGQISSRNTVNDYERTIARAS